LNQDITWTTNLGNAFLSQQADVMDAVQQMRSKAQQAGELSSTTQQTVTTTNDDPQPEIVIEPANPQLMYLPQYDPAYIWGPPLYYPYASWYYPGSYFGFGIGIPMGLYFGGGWGGWGWGFGWGGHNIMVNNSFIHWYNFNSRGMGRPVWNQRMVPRCLASPGRTTFEFRCVQPLRRQRAPKVAIARNCRTGAISRRQIPIRSRANGQSADCAERTCEEPQRFRRRSGGQRGAGAERPRVFEPRARPQPRKAPRAGAEHRAGVGAAATAVADIDRSEKIMAKINSIDSKGSPQRLAWLLAASLVIGAILLPERPKGRPADIRNPAGGRSGHY
jgi:hypothetical protein